MTRLARRVVREISLQEATVLWGLGVEEGDGWMPSTKDRDVGEEMLIYQWMDNPRPEIFVEAPVNRFNRFYLLEEVKDDDGDEHST